jgi:glycosyltransferase involved in cell wall biosynthesis
MENGLVNVATGLPPDEFDIHVCCLEYAGRFVRRLPDPENVYVLDKARGLSIRTVWRLARLIRRIDPDIVHSHNFGPMFYSALATGWGFSRPILQGEHGQLPPEQLIPRVLWQRRLLYRACKKVVTVSESLRRHLLDLRMPAERMTAIVNGVDTVRFRPGDRTSARRAIGLPDGALVFGIIGRVNAAKRHAALIEAVIGLAKNHDVHLLVVGDGGDEYQRIRTLARDSAASARIHFAGYQPDTVAFHQALDLLVAPSMHEGLSNVILEAMACGVPTLCHHACGNTEAVTHGVDGWVADLDSPEKIRRELESIVTARTQMIRFGKNARSKAEKAFSIDRMVDEYAAAYRQLALT